MHGRWFALALILVVAFAGPTTTLAGDARPVVVELFTSEGCSSCPPADAFLAELVKRPDVLALAFHVDYWDYLGWTDRFASPEFTRRQRAYAAALGSAMVYTPQAVVDGAAHVVGSDRGRLGRLIDEAKANDSTVAIDLAWTSEGNLRVSVPAADFRGDATVWFVRFDAHGSSEVTDGENAGKTLHHVNIVRELKAIGMWDGSEFAVTLPAEAVKPPAADGDGYGCAIIVQPEGLGPVLGARLIDASS
ncbi:MAG: DUF1223 domain-containing protein [Alphaproteobacteria bacterium]